MASVIKEFVVGAPADLVWEALADFGAVHRKVAPGFLKDVTMDGDVRVVTFANGLVAREQFVAADTAARRLVYTIAHERLAHHSASAQVFPDRACSCRFVWITDVLPDAAAETISAMMDEGVEAMKTHFARQAAAM